MQDWFTSRDGEMILRLTVAAGLGLVIGFERERHRHAAGLRTLTLVTMGAAIFTLASIYGFGQSDPARVAAQIVSGVGFLGAGTVFVARDKVRGLTTAASVWLCSALGILAGTGLYVLAIYATVLAWLVLALIRVPEVRYRRKRKAATTR